ncbi:MAG TPA: fumarate/nitrate reduction transcriptional regulator Fnr [Gammaproteobacteria bacterium]|nr:fumarate/nitrate reduction transcriptional regulator Fnr [Gammaproteobacteria bacterium]
MTKKNRTLKLEELKITCQDCSLSDLCLPHGMDNDELVKLESIVVHHQPVQPGQHLFRSGDTSHSLFAVRSGALKSYCITEDGEEQVLGFTLPGELTGMDGLGGGSYASAAVALETSSICEMPFNKLEGLCNELPGLHRQLMGVMGRVITEDQRMLMLLGKRTAEERLASFLISLSIRYHQRGLSATEFNLPMSRQDIGNYLGLAIETVSRLFAHFQEKEMVRVNRRRVVITDLGRIKSMVEPCVQHNMAMML